MRVLTRYVRLPIFIQIVNLLEHIFKVKDSNGIHWQFHNALEPLGLWARPRQIRGGQTIPNTTISRGVGNGDGLPCAKICQGVLAYGLILSECNSVHCHQLHSSECDRMCVYLCVCVCVCCDVGVCVYV